MKFLCGAARRDITPSIGTALFGYRPDVFSKSVHDPLDVTAVAFSDGDKVSVLISATVCEIRNDISLSLREAAAEAAGVKRDDIILAATHTHCAPNVAGMDGWGEVDFEYIDSILKPAVKEAAKDAVGSLCEAEIGVEEGESLVGINRRQLNRNDTISLGQNPWGPFDPIMTVIAIRRADDKKGIVNIVHYGCHGTACGCGYEITRDWSGMMLDRMEKLTGTLSTYINGAEGDVGPRLTNGLTVGDISYVEELGSQAAADAMRIFKKIKTYGTPETRAYHGKVTLPYKPMPQLEAVKKELSGYTEPEKLINVQKLWYGHLKEVEEYLESGRSDMPEGYVIDQVIIRVGDIVFIPFPFEIFSEISIRLREYSGFRHTLSLACSNGTNGYLPTQSELCRGGYEVDVFKCAGLFNPVDNADWYAVNDNLNILERG
ncbi:MAG: hypothetical protein K6D94_02450 [Clostridiales bacterium]|nr:hypothetical protein [Clostridiales bacterium]